MKAVYEIIGGECAIDEAIQMEWDRVCALNIPHNPEQLTYWLDRRMETGGDLRVYAKLARQRSNVEGFDPEQWIANQIRRLYGLSRNN